MHVDISQQHSKKDMSDSLGPVVFSIGLVNSVVIYNLPNGKSEVSWGNSNYRRLNFCNQSGEESSPTPPPLPHLVKKTLFSCIAKQA